VEDDELGTVRCLGQHSGEIVNQVAGTDGGRPGPGQADCAFESSPTLTMIRPNARQQPLDRIIVMHADWIRIQTASPDNARNRRGERDGSGRRALQVNGRGRLTDGSRSQFVIKLVEEQTQASARTNLDERQGSRRQRR
jgi:hypothetical protein